MQEDEVLDQTNNANAPEDVVRELYSPRQAGVGSYLGGPFAALYFIWSNFKTTGDETRAKGTLTIGIPVAIGFCILAYLITLVPHNQGSSPAMLVNLIYLAIAQWYVGAKQLSKEKIKQSSDYTFQSNWKVTGIGIAIGISTFIILMIVALLLNAIGVIHIA